ncbi:2-isopropylmalate synthase [bacterium]|nr:2-isopropylmalate synthase [bacterium]
MAKQPFFYDITLRDGNQSLKKPWNIQEKEYVFKLLTELGIPAIEVGFPASSEMDFDAVKRLSEIAPKNVTISGLARTVENDIIKAIEAIQPAEKRRLHTFIAMSPFNMKYVLNKTPEEVQKTAIEAVSFAKEKLGKNADIEFSAEHFGDCMENLDFVIDSFQKVVKAGATTINLPNTVERTRIKTFTDMVEKVYNALPKDINISVHCHNDLGMATAATVESYFSGAVQLETALNGLGERAGNTNFYEVAVALYNSDVDVPVDLSKIYETALIISEMSKVAIYEKAPLIGPEALAHRSGIHQDGAVKTKDMKKGAYRAIHPSLIGRKDDEKLGVTSQSGKTAVYEIISRSGYPITIQEAGRITPFIKESAEKAGELSEKELIDIYFQQVFDVKGPFHIVELEKVNENDYILHFTYNDKIFHIEGKGNGPIDACLNALKKTGFEQKLIHYEQKAIDDDTLGAGATAMTVIKIEAPNGKSIIARGLDANTAIANVKAIFNGLNIIAKLN